MTFQMTGALISMIAIGLLQTAWRKKERSWPLVVLGWSAIAASLTLWSFSTSADKGVALGLVTCMVSVLSFLFFTTLKSPMRPNRRYKAQGNPLTSVTPYELLDGVLTTFFMVPLAGASALIFATTSFQLLQTLGLEHTANLTIVSFLFPIVWGVLAVAMGYQSKFNHRLALLCCFVIAPAIYLWLMG